MIRYLFAFLLFINSSQSLFSQELLNSNFDNVTKNEINKLIKNYILDNPEIVIEAIELFQKQQSLNAIKKEKETIKSLNVELYDDTNSYFFGNENSELKIVEFIDYNCGYCKKNHEIIECPHCLPFSCRYYGICPNFTYDDARGIISCRR